METPSVGYTKSQALLLAKAGSMSANLKAQIAAGTVVFTDSVAYIRKAITAGTFDMFDDSDDKVVGVTNLSKQKIDEGTALMIEAIVINYDIESSADPKKGSFCPIDSNAASALQNAEIEIQVDDKTLLRLPINKFRESRTANGPANAYNLGSMKMLTDMNRVQVKIHTPKGEVYTGSAPIVEVAFIGTLLRVK